MNQILEVLDRCPLAPGKPTVVVARTTKAKGIPAIEGLVRSHYWKPTAVDLAEAITVAEASIRKLEAGL
jgi:transketolase